MYEGKGAMKKMKKVRVLLTMLVFSSILIACRATTPIPPVVEPEDLAGEWVADYDCYKYVALHDAKEVLVLRPDGTFTQTLRSKGGYQEKHTGRWRAEKVSAHWLRVYLEGAAYYLYGLEVAHDPAVKIGVWDDVKGEELTIESGRTTVILYATRLLSRSGSLCGHDDELVLQHLPIGDLDAPEYVTFHRPCEDE